jgi:hypothetical protein
MHDERPTTPTSKPVRLTRRQMALLEEEELKKSQLSQAPQHEAEPAAEEIEEEPALEAQTDPATSTEEATAAVEENDVGETEQSTADPETPHKLEQGNVEEVQEESTTQLGTTLETEPDISGETSTAEPEAMREPEQEVPRDDALEEPAAIQTVETHIAPSVEVTSEPEPKTLAAEKPSGEGAMTPVASRTSSRRASRSPSKSPMRIEESFEALDALEEALENVKTVTSFNHPIEEKSPRKKTVPKTTDTPITRSKTPRKTPVATKVSKTPNAAPKSMKPTTSLLARASSVRVAPSKDVRKGSTETVDYLASKRRPISVSFPTPPPPPKGRAPTKPTFQLSSSNVVAKLKAQKEERLKREAEGVAAPKQRPISMPPPAKSSKPVTKPNFQLPGEKIAEKLRARKEERQERLNREVNAPRQSLARPTSMIVQPPKSTKPPTKANFELPGAAVAEKLKIQKEKRLKRMEEAEAAKKEAAAKARTAPVRKVSIPVRPAPSLTIPPPTQSSQAQRSSSLASKRSSIIMPQSRSTSTSSANRSSVIVTKSTVTPVDAAAQKVKGREVFNRDRMEKNAKERERKEKEEAAKKARAEAAERGRIASREWAEKQRRKMMGMA